MSKPLEYGRPWWEVMKELADENARLKAEVERCFEMAETIKNERKSAVFKEGIWYVPVVELKAKEADCLVLKAEVERLTEVIRREVDGGVDLREEAQRTVEENHNLRAEVERLRKAGDAMAQEIIGCYRGEGYDPADSETLPKWYAAKEGRPNE